MGCHVALYVHAHTQAHPYLCSYIQLGERERAIERHICRSERKKCSRRKKMEWRNKWKYLCKYGENLNLNSPPLFFYSFLVSLSTLYPVALFLLSLLGLCVRACVCLYFNANWEMLFNRAHSLQAEHCWSQEKNRETERERRKKSFDLLPG